MVALPLQGNARKQGNSVFVDDEYLALPRGCEDAVITLLREKGVPYQIEDKSNHGKPISVQLMGANPTEIHPGQNAMRE